MRGIAVRKDKTRSGRSRLRQWNNLSASRDGTGFRQKKGCAVSTARRVPGGRLPFFNTRRFCPNRESAAGGGPGRCPPRQRVKTAAKRTKRPPFETLPATSGADIAGRRHLRGASVETSTRAGAD